MEIIAILAGFLLLMIVLLAIPIDLDFYLKKDQTVEYQAELCLFFGLVTINMTKLDNKAKKDQLPKKNRKKKKPHLKALLKSKRFIKRLLKLVRDLVHSFRIKELTIHGHIGLGDPADTGVLLGLLQPILLPWKNATLSADFQETIFEGYCKAEIRLFPIQVIGYLLAFIFSGATMHMMESVKNR